MNCIICDRITDAIYNSMPICIVCKQASMLLENKYDNDLANNLNYVPPTKILDNLYIGSKLSTIDKNELIKLNITHIIIAGKFINKFNNDNNFTCLELLIDDSLEQNLLEHLNITNKFIDDNKSSNILIYCNSGISRSASVLIGYLMHHFKWNYDVAYTYLKSKYSKAHPNSNFISQLIIL